MDAGEALLLLLLIPGAAMLLTILVPSRHANVVRWIALIATTATLIDSIWIFAVYDFAEGGYQFDLQYPWIENIGFLGENGISLHLAVDGIAAPMVLLNGLVGFAGVLVSWKITHRVKDFFILFMALFTGVYGVYIGQDLFFWFFAYELAVLPMYLLIVIWGSTNKEYGAMKLTMVLVGGSVLIFVGIFAVFAEAGAGTFDMAVLRDIEFGRGFANTFFPFFMIGCGILAGLFPFHTWSPDGHVAAPTAVSMLHAGVLMKLGAFGIIRLGMEILPRRHRFLDARPARAGRRGRRLRRDLGDPPDRPQVCDRLFVRLPYGLRPDGSGDDEQHRCQRRRAADVLARRDDCPLLRHGRRTLRPGAYQGHPRLRRTGAQDAAVRDLLRDRRTDVARLTRISRDSWPSSTSSSVRSTPSRSSPRSASFRPR